MLNNDATVFPTEVASAAALMMMMMILMLTWMTVFVLKLLQVAATALFAFSLAIVSVITDPAFMLRLLSLGRSYNAGLSILGRAGD